MLKLEFTNTDGQNSEIFLQDQRRFSKFKFLFGENTSKFYTTIGPQINHITSETFVQLYRAHPKKRICDLLINQVVVSGIGNYIRADAMYLAGIHPLKLVKDLTDEQLFALHEACIEVVRNSLSAGATTVHGDYENRLHHGKYEPIVYQKKHVDGHEVDVITIADRSIYWVPDVQV